MFRSTLLALLPTLFLPTTNGSAQSAEQKIVDAARSQIGKTLHYDSGYRSMSYPNGDIPIEVGVCTDVVIRALRTAHSMDLQKLVHEDMAANFSRYPKNWGLKRPDRNIDHRRVPNLRTFLSRKGYSIPLTETPDYKPGDLVTCIVPPHLPHIMIVSDRKSAEGTPLVIHNIGSGARKEDRLKQFKITGHYRLKFASSPSDTQSSTSAPTNSASVQYVVGSKNDGGTLTGIAKLHYGDASKWRTIYDANRTQIANPNVIRAGMTLRIPRQ